MHFHFSHINHNIVGASTLNDMYDWFYAGLTSLGHQVTRNAALDRGAINILWENFRPGMGASLAAENIKYGIIATELPDSHGGFNWRSDDPWPLRFSSFAETASGALFIWSMIEESCAYYSQFAPCAFVELGFSESLLPKKSIINRKPTHDFGFFGLHTPYRDKLVEDLSRNCKVIWPEYMSSTSDIIDFISTTRIGLNFRQSEIWPIPSPTRLGRYLHSKRLLVSERTKIPTRQGLLVEMAPPEADYREFCLSALEFDWRQKADDALHKYSVDMPMHRIMQQVLDLTLIDRSHAWGRLPERPRHPVIERVSASLSASGRKIVDLFQPRNERNGSCAVSFEDNQIWHQALHIDTVGNFELIDYSGLCYCLNKSKNQVDFTDKKQRQGIVSFQSIDEARAYAIRSIV